MHMNVLAKGSLIKKQMILMGGDAIIGMGILLLWITRPNGPSPDIFSGLWVTGFIPILIFSSYICEVYNIQQWFLKKAVIRPAIANTISLAILIFLNKISLPFNMILGVFFFLHFKSSGRPFTRSQAGPLFFQKTSW